MSSGQVTGPTQTASDQIEGRKWERHPWIARAVRFSIFIFPVVIAVLASLWASRKYPPDALELNKWVWWIGLAVLAMGLVNILERIMAKLTPLTMLFRLSLIFPDQAPSRFSTALKTGSPRALKRRLAEIQESGEVFDQDQTYSAQLLELMAVLSEHDRMTRGHTERVRAYAELIGEEMGLNEEDLGKLRWSALLHDMGKLHVPAEILNKAGRPDEDEWAILKAHPAKAEAYLEPLADWLGEWRYAAVGHHERWDGNGYPAGLAGNDIPLSARIVAVADAFDVMTSTRSYKKPMPAELARQEVADKAGSQFDPAVSRAFLNIGLGDLRRTAGPLAFLTNLPLFGTGSAATQVVTTTIASTATAAAAAVAVTVTSIFGGPLGDSPPPELAFVEPETPAVAAPNIILADLAGNEDESIPGLLIVEGEAPFTVRVTQAAGFGEVSIASEMTDDEAPGLPFTYTPEPNRYGTDSFVVEICDVTPACTEQSVDVVVAPIGDAPTMVPPVLEVREGQSASVPLTVNDLDGDDVTVSVSAQPENARVAVTTAGLELLHDGSETTQVFFELLLRDGTSTVAQPVTVQVIPVNDAPVAEGRSVSVTAGETVSLDIEDLLSNASDAEGDNLSIGTVTDSPNGTAAVRANGTIVFAPSPGFTGDTSFTYTASDGQAESAPVDVFVTVIAGATTTTTTSPTTTTTAAPPPPNEPPTVTVTPSSFAENAAGGTVVGTAAATDPEGDAVEFAITSSTLPGSIAINPSTGALSVASSIDFETTPSITLTVTATDTAGDSTSQTTTITVNDVNEPAVFEPVTALRIAENSPAGTLVTNGTIDATDPEGDAITYSVVDLSNTFTIDPVTGELSVASPGIDFETSATYAMTVIADDQASGATTSLPVQVTIVDVNEIPTVAAPAIPVVSESTPPGSIIGQVAATDVDGDTLTYAIVGGTGAAQFDIDTTTGEIALALPLNFETDPSFSLDIEVTDNGSPTLTTPTTTTIDIGDANELPIVDAGQTVSIAENTAVGTPATGAAITATDPESGTVTFSLVDAGGLFVIDATTGVISRGTAPLDFETTPAHTVTVVATDPSGNTGDATVTITVLDRNDAPDVQPFATPVPIDENQPAQVIATATVADADNDGLAFALTGPDAALFSVDSDGAISSTGPLDYETQSQYDLTLTVTDDGLPAASSSTPVTIVVGPVNEAPTVDPAQVFRIDENSAAGAWVTPTTIAANDIDGDALTYSLVDPLNTFVIDPATGKISTAGPIDHEGESSYDVVITVEDPGLLTASSPARILIEDLNEAPTLVVPAAAQTIAENSTIGTVVTSAITSVDPEGDTPTYSLVDLSNSFTIDPATGDILVAAPLDFETLPNTYTVAVTVDDAASGGTGTDTQSVTIGVVNAPERPVISTTTLADVNEGAALVWSETLVATDVDGGTLSWAITGGSGDGIFAIDPTTGELTTNGPFDYETGPTSYTIEVTVTDPDMLTDTATYNVGIANVDEPPVIDPSQIVTIDEELPAGSAVSAAVSFTDPEGDPVTTWSVSDPSGNFTIDPTTGILSSTATFDFETGPTEFPVVVTATAAAGTSTEVVIVDVTPVDERPLFILDSPVNISILEDSPAGTIDVLDVDSPEVEPLTFSIDGGTGVGVFDIDPATGEVSLLAANLDFETTPSYSLDVRVADTDDPSLFDVRELDIFVTDVNEPGSLVTTIAPSVPENVPLDSVVSPTVQYIDADGGGTFLPPRYELIDASGLFAMESSSGVITLATGTLDYETLDSYPITINVYDDSLATPLMDSWTTTISITNVNEAPEIEPPASAFTVEENLPVGSSVGTMTFTDPDVGDTHEFGTLGSIDPSYFTIDPVTGEITTLKVFDYETDPATSFTADVLVQDDGGLIDQLPITIDIIDVNEAPAVTPGLTFSMVDDQEVDDVLGTVTASDIEGDAITGWAITSGDPDNLFEITPAGEITIAKPIDFDNGAIRNLAITATDNGSPAATSAPEIVTIEVNSQFGPNPSPFFGQVVFNELRYTSHLTGENNDFLEFRNLTGADISIAGWTVTDSPLGTFADPVGNMQFSLPAGAFARDGLVRLPVGLRAGDLQSNDDVFLYDENDLLVAYIAWGDATAPDSEIGTRPPLDTWNLWDPTNEVNLSTSDVISIASAVDSATDAPVPNEWTLSQCWEVAGSGDAASNGCAGSHGTIAAGTAAGFSTQGFPNAP